MRILLFRDALTPASPPRAATFIMQVVRQAAEQGHELRELVSHPTAPGKREDDGKVELRRRLDAEVLAFDPEVVHVHGVGILAHLALESGVPYLVSALGEDLSSGQSGFPLRMQAQQGLENAGFVVVDGDEMRRQLEDAFGRLEAVFVAPKMEPASTAGSLDWLWPLYERIVAVRRGRGK